MELTITLKEDSVIQKKGPYFVCYCGSMKLGTYNLIVHVATTKECGDKFTNDMTYSYPPSPKRK